jgi:hypothetical protein
MADFVAYARTQFGFPVKCFQADNGTEFTNNATHSFLAAHGIIFHLSCPYTSPQNGKAGRVLRTLNNCVRTLLIQASMAPSYWAEALAAATYLLNWRPSSINHEIPYAWLHKTPPSYEHLLVFGCLCYPNLQATSPHKLAPRSIACVFLGYPSTHKGYRCLDLCTRRIIISRHVVFDEFVFPFAKESLIPASTFDFLLDDAMDTVPCFTNPAAAPSRGDAPAPMAAPSSPDVGQLLPLSRPGGCGLVPLPGSLHVAGGSGSVPPSGPSSPGGCGFVLPSGPCRIEMAD